MLSDDRYTLEKKYVPYQEEEEGNVVGACRAIMSSPDEAPLASRCIFPTKASQPAHSRLRLPKLRPGAAGTIWWRVPACLLVFTLAPICSLHA